jgi:hypothetical protein
MNAACSLESARSVPGSGGSASDTVLDLRGNELKCMFERECVFEYEVSIMHSTQMEKKKINNCDWWTGWLVGS